MFTFCCSAVLSQSIGAGFSLVLTMCTKRTDIPNLWAIMLSQMVGFGPHHM